MKEDLIEIGQALKEKATKHVKKIKKRRRIKKVMRKATKELLKIM